MEQFFNRQTASPEQKNQDWLNRYQYLIEELISDNFPNVSPEDKEDLEQDSKLVIMEVARDLEFPEEKDFRRAILNKLKKEREREKEKQNIEVDDLFLRDLAGDINYEGILLKISYFDNLPPKDKEVLESYFGLNGKPKLSIDQIREEYKIGSRKLNDIIERFRVRAKILELRAEEEYNNI
jgi:hypothetical protein